MRVFKQLKLILWLCVLSSVVLAAPLPANKAFQISANMSDPNNIQVQWKIQPGYFLYKSSINYLNSPNGLIQLEKIIFPTSTQYTDAQGNMHEIYRNNLQISIPVLAENAGETQLNIKYQGCSDAGFCYPPQTYLLTTVINPQTKDITLHTPDSLNQSTNTTHNLSSFLLIILSFYGIGLLLSLTPCVLPMVPVLSGMIVGHGHDISTKKAFLLSACYVLSMSVTYSIVGAIIALLGKNLQVIMQSAWTIGIFSAVFVLLALSMFKCFTISMPQIIQIKLSQISRKQISGHYLSIIIMGCLSTLILSPCVTGPMIGALSYIAQQGQVLLGMLDLFFLSLGMGTPLLLIGMSAGKILPKAGAWMNSIQKIFGFLFFAMAIDLLSRILPPLIIMHLWGILLFFAGIYCGALQKAVTETQKFCHALGILFTLYGVLIIFGASQGNTNFITPLLARTTSSTQNQHGIIVTTLQESKDELAKAKGHNVMLDFYADWCTSCKVLKRTLLVDPEIQTALKDVVVITVDLSKNDTESQNLLKYFNVVAPPTFIFFDKNGHEVNDFRLYGKISKQDLLSRQLH